MDKNKLKLLHLKIFKIN